jgi:putative endonuclease
MPYVYILRCADGSLYTGIAKDVERRVKQHQAGRGGRYTAAHRPVELIWRREVDTWHEAMLWERTIKKLSREEKTRLVCP